MVLNCVIGASGEKLGDDGPFVAILSMCSDDGFIFFRGEWSVADIRIELVAPAEAARFARTARNAPANERPIARTMLLDEECQLLVVFGAPWAFDSSYY